MEVVYIMAHGLLVRCALSLGDGVLWSRVHGQNKYEALQYHTVYKDTLPFYSNWNVYIIVITFTPLPNICISEILNTVIWMYSLIDLFPKKLWRCVEFTEWDRYPSDESPCIIEMCSGTKAMMEQYCDSSAGILDSQIKTIVCVKKVK